MARKMGCAHDVASRGFSWRLVRITYGGKGYREDIGKSRGCGNPWGAGCMFADLYRHEICNVRRHSSSRESIAALNEVAAPRWSPTSSAGECVNAGEVRRRRLRGLLPSSIRRMEKTASPRTAECTQGLAASSL